MSDGAEFRMPRQGSPKGPPVVMEEVEAGPPRLAADAVVDLEDEVRGSQVFEVLEQLDRELVGLAPVKTRIREVASLLLVDSERPTLHMCFTGSPGTGKTTVAVRMAEVLHRLGYLAKGHLVAVTRDDLVGQYIGHTAPKTREVLKRAMGGVLFIDEAYYLYRAENERDYGQEAIEILLQVMENQRDDIVVILAGYRDRMDTFFQSTPGMSSRIAHHIDFPEYTMEELMGIARLLLDRQRYRLTEDGERAFRELMERRMQRPRFANGRSVRNALERARLRQASRLVTAGGSVGRDDLMLIDGEDIRRSRLFDTEEAETEAAPANGRYTGD
jgi:probable Rubsico expression protein CbbX